MTARKADAAMVVCQNNKDRSLVIETVNAAFEELCGKDVFLVDTLVGRSLLDFLAPEAKKKIKDFIEFSKDGNDLADVLGKTRVLALETSYKEKIRLSMKIQRYTSLDENPRFILYFRNFLHAVDPAIRALNEWRKTCEPDPITQLATLENFMHEATILYQSASEKQLYFALIVLDQFEEIEKSRGKKLAESLLHQVGVEILGCFRNTDALGYIGEGMFVAVLYDVKKESATIPLNRLRWRIAYPKAVDEKNQPFPAALNIAFVAVKPGDEVPANLEQCMEKLSSSVSLLQPVVEV